MTYQSMVDCKADAAEFLVDTRQLPAKLQWTIFVMIQTAKLLDMENSGFSPTDT